MRQNTMRFRRLWCLVGVAALAGSCIVDQNQLGPDETDDGLTTFTVKLPATQSVGTRATENDENYIATLDILLLDHDTETYIESVPGEIVTGNGDDEITVKARIPYSEDSYDLLFVANVVLPSLSAGADRDEVQTALVQSKTDAWVVGEDDDRIPMFGELTGQQVTGSYNPPTGDDRLKLRRMLARVNVEVDEDARGDFKLSKVHFYNYNTSGNLIPGNSNPSIPTTGSGSGKQTTDAPKAFVYDASVGVSCLNQIYVFENENEGVFGSGDDWLDNPCIVVEGSYNGGPASFYRLDFITKDEDTTEWLDVIRNYSYNFHITSVSGHGYGTAGEALISAPVNMESQVYPWDENDMGEVIFDGSKYISVTPRTVTFLPFSGLSESVIIKTNIADFSLTYDGTTLQPGKKVSHTDDYYEYLLSGPTGPKTDTYTLTISTLQANIAEDDQSVPSRAQTWTVNASRVEGLNIAVDQPKESTYISMSQAERLYLMPEGATKMPINVAWKVPIDIEVVYGDDDKWITLTDSESPIPTSTTLRDGINIASFEFDVKPYKWKTTLPTTRTATITLTPRSGDDAWVYTIVQEAPYLRVNPANINLQRPDPGTEIIRTINVQTNLPYEDITLNFDDQESTIVHTPLTSAGSFAPPRHLSFKAVINTTLGDNERHESDFSLVPDVKYAMAPARGQVRVGGTEDVWKFSWRSYTPFGASTETTLGDPEEGESYYFPWNTTQVGFDIESNLNVVNSTVPASGSLSHTVSSSQGGDLLTAYTYVFGYPDASQQHTYNFVFEGESVNGDKSKELTFYLGAQTWSMTQTPITTDYKASTPTVPVTSNIEWAVAVNEWKENTDDSAISVNPADPQRWLNVHTEDTPGWASPSALNGSTVTQNDHMTVVGTTTVPTDETNLSLQIPVMALNPTVTGGTTPLVSRSATVIFGNNDADANGDTGIDISNQSITVTQYAPVLKSKETNLPTEDNIPTEGGPYTITATTNLQGWGVRVYEGSTLLTPPGNVAFGNTPTISATAPAGEYSVTVNVPPFGGLGTRTLRFVLYHAGFAEQEVAEIEQDGIVLEGGDNHVLYFTGDAQYPLKVGRWATTLTDEDNTLGVIQLNESDRSKLAFFKFGSVVGFTNGGTFTPASILFDPTGKTYTGTGSTTYGQITGLYTTGDYPKNVSDPINYHTASNLANGKGDPCMLAGLSMDFIKSEIAEGRAPDSGWRLPTNEENRMFIGNAPTDASTRNANQLYSGTVYYQISPASGWSSSNPGTGIFPANTERSDVDPRLPASGYRDTTNGDVSYRGSYGLYWSSTAGNSAYGYGLGFDGASVGPSSSNDYAYGFAVRCVRP